MQEDVAAAGIASRASAWAHWVEHGRRVAPVLASGQNGDGDDGNTHFDWRAHLDLHPELARLGIRSKSRTWARAKAAPDSAACVFVRRPDWKGEDDDVCDRLREAGRHSCFCPPRPQRPVVAPALRSTSSRRCKILGSGLPYTSSEARTRQSGAP